MEITMSAVSNATIAPPFLFLRDKEDSIGFKILSAIPIIGGLFQAAATYDVNVKLKSINERRVQDVKSATQLLKTENHYLAINIARNFLIIAGVVTLFALGFFGIIPLVALGAGYVAYTAFCSYKIYQNQKLVQELENTQGFSGDRWNQRFKV